MKKNVKRADVIFIGILIILALVFLIYQKFGTNVKGDMVEITVDGELYGTYSLAQNQEIPILEGEDNCNTVVIKNHEAYMEDADCPDKLCMKQGKISKNSESIVCLPNKVVVSVISNEDSQFDSMAK